MNVHGGAIAVGHPFGMTGARITDTLLNGPKPKDKSSRPRDHVRRRRLGHGHHLRAPQLMGEVIADFAGTVDAGGAFRGDGYASAKHAHELGRLAVNVNAAAPNVSPDGRPCEPQEEAGRTGRPRREQSTQPIRRVGRDGCRSRRPRS
ncbi:hypothetical protein [Pseudonocardia xishanensis]|uniref:hypothetical protein n=1 Tax=Pseudonocardia xishanensis TaxID=630995 RepID=UPI003CD0985A